MATCKALLAASTPRPLRRILDGTDRIERPGGLVARLCACTVLSRLSRQPLDGFAKQHFRGDHELAALIEMKAAVAPASTSVAGWAAELVGTAVADLTSNVLPASVLSQLRGLSGASYVFVNGAIVRAPSVVPSASARFVLEGGPISALRFSLSSNTLGPKKLAAITAFTKELASGSPINVEIALRSLLADDLQLSADTILLDATAADATRPPGLLNGLVATAPSATGTLTDKIAADVKVLLGAIAPAMRPALVVQTVQSATLDAVGSLLPKIASPVLPAGTVVAIDASAFASALGVLDFSVSEQPLVHEEDTAPLPISTPGAPATHRGTRSQLVANRERRHPRRCFRRIGACAARTPSRS